MTDASWVAEKVFGKTGRPARPTELCETVGVLWESGLPVLARAYPRLPFVTRP